MFSSRFRSRRTRAQSLVEAAAGLMCAIPVFLCLYDIIMVYIGYNTNLTACRDACRAASTAQPPEGYTGGQGITAVDCPAGSDWKKKAFSMCKSLEQKGSFITGPELLSVKVSQFVAPGPNGGNYQGFISTSTKVVVKLPASIPHISPESIPITTNNTFPITASQNPFAAGGVVR